MSTFIERIGDQAPVAWKKKPDTLTASAFHMPGKHNQADHGRGGTLRRADKKELKENRKKFDQGKKKAKQGRGALDEVESGQDSEAVRRYTGYTAAETGLATYRPINRGLEDASGDVDALPDDLRSDVIGMDTRMRPTTHDIIVERTVPVSGMGSSFSTNGDNDGLTWRSHRFTSTTVGGSQAQGFEEARLRGGLEETAIDVVHMRILVPAGTPALSNDFTHEAEVILPRSSSFQIVADHGSQGYGTYSDSEARRYSIDVVMLSD